MQLGLEKGVCALEETARSHGVGWPLDPSGHPPSRSPLPSGGQTVDLLPARRTCAGGGRPSCGCVATRKTPPELTAAADARWQRTAAAGASLT